MRKLDFRKHSKKTVVSVSRKTGSSDINFIRLCSLGVAAIFMITVILTVLMINLG